MNMEEKCAAAKKRWLIAAVIACFITILIYELLTPLMSDDFVYQKTVNEAQSVADLFRQEYDHYMDHGGRSVAHFILRVLMYLHSMPLAKTILAAVFTLMTILIYKLTRVTFEPPLEVLTSVTLYILSVLLIWIFGVSFADTVLWLTGACNYMVTTTIILADMLLYERIMVQGDRGNFAPPPEVLTSVTSVACATILGLLAGWCNENTSGGLILFVLYLMWKRRFREHKRIPAPMIAGFIANIAGFILMLSSPGNTSRLAAEEMNSNFLVQMAARFFTVTGVIYELFFPLLVAAVIIGFVLHHQGVTFYQAERFYLFLFLFLATSYSLMLAPQTQERTFFGAGIFLLIALLNGLEKCVSVPVPLTHFFIKAVLTAILLLYMFFTYVDSSAKLIWIYRESTERMDYLEEQQAAGKEESGAPLLRPQFETKYSAAYRMDLDEEFTYWVNGMYAEYYDLNLVWGVPRDEWTAY